jgi:hypothetical protein
MRDVISGDSQTGISVDELRPEMPKKVPEYYVAVKYEGSELEMVKIL